MPASDRSGRSGREGRASADRPARDGRAGRDRSGRSGGERSAPSERANRTGGARSPAGSDGRVRGARSSTGGTRASTARGGGGRPSRGTPGTRSGGRAVRVSDRHRVISAEGRNLGFKVTSTLGGKHNSGSLHARGRAVDFSVKGKTAKQVNDFKAAMRAKGFSVRDERTRPRGQKVWSGPHIHVSDPRR